MSTDYKRKEFKTESYRSRGRIGSSNSGGGGEEMRGSSSSNWRQAPRSTSQYRPIYSRSFNNTNRSRNEQGQPRWGRGIYVNKKSEEAGVYRKGLKLNFLILTFYI